MSDQQFSEEEIKALEAEMEKITVDDVLLQTTVTLLNLAARKAGLAAAPSAPAPTPEWDQVGLAIDGARALLPLLEPRHREQVGPIRDMVAQLQMVYAQQSSASGAAAAGDRPSDQPAPAPPTGTGPGTAPAPDAGTEPGGPGPAQRSGRLWVPGQ